MKNTAHTKEQTKATSHDSASTDSELYKLGTKVTAAFAVAVGIWGLICLASVLISDGNPVALVKNLFSAIFGN
ncbi:MAG: hypothetical protein PHZ02_06415 [Desulfocapsaceae bacterium]|nr:hypothetical protein [Desulfocapsaceae bacterium]